MEAMTAKFPAEFVRKPVKMYIIPPRSFGAGVD
jgi:hypothetical protein